MCYYCIPLSESLGLCTPFGISKPLGSALGPQWYRGNPSISTSLTGILSALLLLFRWRVTQLLSSSALCEDREHRSSLFSVSWVSLPLSLQPPRALSREPRASRLFAFTVFFLPLACSHLHCQRESLSSLEVMWMTLFFLFSLLFITYILMFLKAQILEYQKLKPLKMKCLGFWNSKAMSLPFCLFVTVPETLHYFTCLSQLGRITGK